MTKNVVESDLVSNVRRGLRLGSGGKLLFK
jgi:hypothetical protein